MYQRSDAFGGRKGMIILQPGILDDNNVIENLRPGLEMLTEDRVKWIVAIDGLAQHETMTQS